MTSNEYINYHENRLDRLNTNVEYQTRTLAIRHSHSLARAKDVLNIGEELKKLEIEIRISREIISTLRCIEQPCSHPRP